MGREKEVRLDKEKYFLMYEAVLKKILQNQSCV